MVTTNAERPRVDLQLTCDAPDLPGITAIERWFATTITASGREVHPNTTVSVRLVNEAEIRHLNRHYRGSDKPTNVLAFPAHLDKLPGLPAEDAGLIGDLVLCPDVVLREALEQGKRTEDHWAHLLVHGMLHLLGFDHQNSDEADIMEGLETRILEVEGFENPYEDRHSS